MRRIFISLAVLAVLVVLAGVAFRLICGYWPFEQYHKSHPNCVEAMMIKEASNKFYNVEVVRVIDGNTLVAKIDGKEEQYRLLYIDTPEEGEMWFEEVKNALEEYIKDKKVFVRFGPPGEEKRDMFGRPLVLVYVEVQKRPPYKEYSSPINLSMISDGWSPYYTKYGRAGFLDRTYRKFAENAKKAKRGIWAEE